MRNYSVYLNKDGFRKLLPHRCPRKFLDKPFKRWGSASHNQLDKQRVCPMLLIHSVHEDYYSWWDIGCTATMSNMVLVCQTYKDITYNYKSVVHSDSATHAMKNAFIGVKLDNHDLSTSLELPYLSCQPGWSFIGGMCIHLVACCLDVPIYLPPHISNIMNNTSISEMEHVKSTMWSFLDMWTSSDGIRFSVYINHTRINLRRGCVFYQRKPGEYKYIWKREFDCQLHRKISVFLCASYPRLDRCREQCSQMYLNNTCFEILRGRAICKYQSFAFPPQLTMSKIHLSKLQHS